MKLPFKTFLTALGASASLLLLSSTAAAEQIRLTNGQIIQGDVIGSPTTEGFTFRLTKSGGQAFFRWAQIHGEDEARIRNIKDPDAGINLIVYMTGDRLNLDVGDPLEGRVSTETDHYLVTNLKYKSGRKVPLDEVAIDQPIQKNVQIDARVMLPPVKVLEHHETTTMPATAQDWYVCARIAEHLGLIREAQDRLTRCLEQGPTSKLLATAEVMKLRLDELLKQEQVLTFMDEVRKIAEKDAYAYALSQIDDAIKTAKPTGAIKTAMDQLRVEVDTAYTDWVIKEWLDTASSTARTWMRENKKATVTEGLNYARRTLEQDMLRGMAAIVRGDGEPKLLGDNILTRDIKGRMEQRLQEPRVKKLKSRSADFTKDGWYTVVGGNLPVQGQKRASTPAGGQAGGNPGQPPRFPRGNGNRGGNGAGGRPDFWKPAHEWSGDSDPIGGFQEGPPRGSGEGRGNGGNGGSGGDSEKKDGDDGIGDVVGDAIEEYIRRMAEAKNKKDDPNGATEGGPRGPSRKYDAEDARMKVPPEVKSMQEWWESIAAGQKVRWMLAAYYFHGRTMDIVSENYYRFSFR